MITAELPPDQEQVLDCMKSEKEEVDVGGGDSCRYDIRLQKVLGNGEKVDINLKMNSLGKYYVV